MHGMGVSALSSMLEVNIKINAPDCLCATFCVSALRLSKQTVLTTFQNPRALNIENLVPVHPGASIPRICDDRCIDFSLG